MRLGLHTVSRAVSVPAVRALSISGILWLVVFVYCNFTLYRDPHGAYFHIEHIYDLKYSVARQQEARAFLKTHSNTDIPLSDTSTLTPPSLPSSDPSSVPPSIHRTDEHPALCAAFTTIRRDHPDAAHYFSDSIGSMLAGLSSQERAAFNLTVLFANSDPTIHPDYNAPWLTALVDHASGYERISDADRAELRRLEEARDFQRKGVLDYIYLLDQCYHETNAPFIAIFEDDVIFSSDWLSRTLLGLQHLAFPQENGVIQSRPLDEPPWLYLRLFYTETALMWGTDDWLYRHLFLTFCLATLTTATVLVLLRHLLQTNNALGIHSPITPKIWNLGLRLDMPTIATLSLIVAPAFTALFFMAGKYNIPAFKLHRGLTDLSGTHYLADAGVFPMDKHGCCSQGLVFDRAQVPGLIAHLQTLGRGQTDLMIEDYCDKTHLRRFALGDQVLQHVGLMSSRGISANAQSIYAFYFEERRAEDVRKSQESAVKAIDWGLFRALEAAGDDGGNSTGEEIKQLGILPAG